MASQSGVYVLAIKKLKRCYVGETGDLNRRLIQHIDALCFERHYSRAFQLDFNKFGNVEIINFVDCENATEEQRKIVEKIVMLIYLKNGWQLYNAKPEPTKKNLEWHILYDLLELVKSNLELPV